MAGCSGPTGRYPSAQPGGLGKSTIWSGGLKARDQFPIRRDGELFRQTMAFILHHLSDQSDSSVSSASLQSCAGVNASTAAIRARQSRTLATTRGRAAATAGDSSMVMLLRLAMEMVIRSTCGQ